MRSENAIEVNKISKKFRVFMDKGRTLKEISLFSKRRRYEERKVLKDISFKVKKGEAIGLIGHNGCGKSTILKLLTKIIYPDTGSIVMNGRVSSLIELGAGFHPDMSGRQNIYTNASIFGLTRREINKRIDDIIAFSELEAFIDNPVRTYSSGMYMRLAFSVAINVDADILLIDEILAVGDANFQAKCFNKLHEIKANGTTIVIVSHALGQIEQICERSIWIHEGIIRAQGVPRDIHPQYMEFMGEKRQNNEEKTNKNIINENRWGNADAKIVNIKAFDGRGKESTVFKTGEDITLKLYYEVYKTIKDACFGVGIFRVDGVHCYGVNTKIDGVSKFDLLENGEMELVLEQVNLLPGLYSLDLAIESQNGIAIDYFKEIFRFELYSTVSDIGLCRIKHNWKFNI